MDIDILSLFPGYFSGPFDESIIKRARARGIINIRQVNIRDFVNKKSARAQERRVDERPYGGGPGMVMMAEPIKKAVDSVRRTSSRVVYLSPQGALLTPQKCRELSQCSHLVLLCGHYEGIDERAIESCIDEEISIGDYVLTNGALAAIVLVDAVSRFVPGVLGDETSANEDSFEKGILDCPHYTYPLEFEGKRVPQVLLEGNHKLIEEWRSQEALKKTKKQRPDIYLKYLANVSSKGEENE